MWKNGSLSRLAWQVTDSHARLSRWRSGGGTALLLLLAGAQVVFPSAVEQREGGLSGQQTSWSSS